ncbi:hypothetical protein RchiOBHm_Chr7g0206251 [Rosa chinensis]|uniref:Uncharacterized protein n=1 Tax=Rosa chinensis TaxID=74649 RepID=A0A2P6P954_ROSCH|nr:hypothetical protein RchiOBHm_Chr7g0206251 [Rosa chinensis]
MLFNHFTQLFFSLVLFFNYFIRTYFNTLIRHFVFQFCVNLLFTTHNDFLQLILIHIFLLFILLL